MSTIYLHRTTAFDARVLGWSHRLRPLGQLPNSLVNSADISRCIISAPCRPTLRKAGGVWERLHYNSSNSNRVVLTTTNFQCVGRRVGSHLHLRASAQWSDRH